MKEMRDKNRIMFSIVMPVYNAGAYLEEALNSIEAQEFNSFELILVDDGSTDNSAEIATRFKKRSKLNNISIHRINNRGELGARCYGYLRSSGAFVINCDADDKLSTRCLFVLEKAIKKYHSDAYFYTATSDKDEKMQSSLMAGVIHNDIKNMATAVFDDTFFSVCTKCIRTEIMRDIASCYSNNEWRGICADKIITIEILSRIHSAVRINSVLYHYRLHADSLSHAVKVKHIFDIENSSMLAIRRFRELGILDERLKYAICFADLATKSWRLYELFKQNIITADECEMIHGCKIYSLAKKYEKEIYKRKIHVLNKVVIFLFRRKKYTALKRVARVNCLIKRLVDGVKK